ncbi:MAG: DUF4625 domain-containing protein [Cyclobacteriaceae bacterium]
MKIKILSLIALSIAFLNACDSDDEVDITAPTITLEEPGYGEAFAAGGSIHFDALFEDDFNLATYSINIHDNFDGHSHGRIALTPFSYNESFSISGKSADEHMEIDVPADATAGPYDMLVQAIDAEGNSTSFADGSAIDLGIWITNEEMAHVHFEDADGAEVEEYEGEVGQALAFYGEVEDEEGALDHVKIMVGHIEGAEDHDHDHDDGGRVAEDDDYIFEMEYEVEGETSVMIQSLLEGESITVAQSALDELEEGEHLYLIVQAQDEAGNISQFTIEIHFD